MTDAWRQPVTLEHREVRLEPLTAAHAAPLAEAAATPATFRYFSRVPESLTEAGMRAFIVYLLGPAETVPFCVLDRARGEPIGITTYLDIHPEHRALEIGWTWYTPGCRGTRVNPACKLLLLEHAFDRLGANRVCLKTDERNAQSRAAILRLGASFEGVHRENVLMTDGFKRSTAVYSVLASEWAAVKADLLARLGEPSDDGCRVDRR